MSKHSHKLEHFTLHLLAVLLVFSTISTSFLALGVYQNEIVNYPLVTVDKAQGAYYDPWVQTDWSGGASSDIAPANWGGSSWNKFTSAVNVTTNGNVSPISLSQDSSLVSSIFDLGNARMKYFLGLGNSSYSVPIVSLRGGNSVAALNSAAWVSVTYSGNSFSYCPNYRYIQYKAEWPANSSSVASISETSIFPRAFNIHGLVKNATNNVGITGAVVTYNNTNATTAYKNLPSLVAKAFAAGEGYSVPGEFGFGGYQYDASVSTISLTASKSGYETKTQNFTVSSGSCEDVTADATILLTPASASNSTSDSSNSSSGPTAKKPSTSQTKPVETIVDNSPKLGIDEFKKITLPSIFSKTKTTDPSKVIDHSKVKDFTLAIDEKNEIKFEDALDLSNQNTIEKLKELDKYVMINKVGVIEVDSKALPALNKKAKLTMSGLRGFVALPEVLVDSKVDNSKVVKNISFDKRTGTLKFDVSHFTTFSVTPKLELISPMTSTVKNLADVALKARISDPTATVSGTFNGKELTSLKPNKTSGEIAINSVSFKTGQNILSLSAQSSLGKVTPLVASINYTPGNSFENLAKNPLYFTLFLVASLSAIVFALLLGLFVYRKRKREEKSAGAS